MLTAFYFTTGSATVLGMPCKNTNTEKVNVTQIKDQEQHKKLYAYDTNEYLRSN